VVETILHFAREYRVGYIVIGKPGPWPCLTRRLGRKPLAEPLILIARGVTIVVVDTELKPAHETLP
jgi:two-component system, OmpR family, sensor histidine kinase KdpD